MNRVVRTRPAGERRVPRSLYAVALAAALLLVACPEEAPPDEAPPNDDAVTLELVAESISFDQETLTAPAGAQVRIEFENRDGITHNFALYESEAAEEPIFQGEIVTQDTTYEFQAPEEPGTYFFRCDPHAAQMQGDFIVE